MKMVASRELSARPGKVWSTLEREGAVVITRDGHPCSILVPTSDRTLVDDVRDIVFARARQAVSQIRAAARDAGTSALSMAEIDAEIARSRRERRKRRG